MTNAKNNDRQWQTSSPSSWKALIDWLWLVSERVGRTGVSVLVTAWIARSLGPGEYGTYTLGLTVIAISQVIIGLGVDQILVKRIVEQPQTARDLVANALVLRTIGALSLLPLIAVWILWTSHANANVQLILALFCCAIPIQITEAFDFALQGKSEFRRLVKCRLFSFGIATLVRVVVLLTGGGLIFLAFCVLLEGALTGILVAVAYKRLFGTNQIHPFDSSLSLRKMELLKEGAPLLLSSIGVILYVRADQLIVAQLMGSERLGIYAAMLQFSNVWLVLPGTMASSLLPFLVAARLQGEAHYATVLQQLYSIAFAAGILAYAVTAVAFPLLIDLLLGAEYRESAKILYIHSIGIIAIFWGSVQSVSFVAEGRQRQQVIRTLSTGILSVGMNLLMIPALGLVGAAVTSVLSLFICTVFINIWLDGKTFQMQMKALLFNGGLPVAQNCLEVLRQKLK